MREIARVEKIEGENITIRGGQFNACIGCVNQECQADCKRFIAINRLGLDLKLGQRVELEVPIAAAAAQAALVFLPPLFGFAAFYTAVSVFFPVSGEPARAMGGVFGMALGFLAVFFLRRIKLTKAAPTILSTLPSGDYEKAEAETEYV